MRRLAMAMLVLVALGSSSDPPSVMRARDAFAAVAPESTLTVTFEDYGAYKVEGYYNPTLILYRGWTYYFEVEAYGHPFYIKTTRSTGSADQYTPGTMDQGTDAGILTFAIPAEAPSTLYYQCGVHGTMGGTIEIQDPIGVPAPPRASGLWLGPAAPNPTREGATFRFSLPRSGALRLAIHDAKGRRVRMLADRDAPAGRQSVRWDGKDDGGRAVGNGAYYLRLAFGEGRLSSRVIVTK